jgi:hypothetical protein
MPQPCQRDWDFLLVAAADSICDDVDLVSRSKQIDGGLCDADVTLDADDNAREWASSV